METNKMVKAHTRHSWILASKETSISSCLSLSDSIFSAMRARNEADLGSDTSKSETLTKLRSAI